MLAQSRCLLALVYVLAYVGTITSRNVGESSITNTMIRAQGIFTMTVLFANAFIIFSSVGTALVDIDTLVVGTDHVTDRTFAIVATLTILTDLTGTAFVSIVGALIDVYAPAAAYRIQDETVSTRHSRDASSNIRIFL